MAKVILFVIITIREIVSKIGCFIIFRKKAESQAYVNANFFRNYHKL